MTEVKHRRCTATEADDVDDFIAALPVFTELVVIRFVESRQFACAEGTADDPSNQLVRFTMPAT